MGRNVKRTAPDEGPSAPLWMVTFSDCMNLLLTFFVVLVTFSSYDQNTRQSIKELGGVFKKIFPTLVSWGMPDDKSALISDASITAKEEPEYGAEKPTLTAPSVATVGVLKESWDVWDYDKYKVFVISSKRAFAGKGVLLSPEGRYLMALTASFLKEIPCRVVISENGPQGGRDSKSLGLARAWAVLEYLTTVQNIDKSRFSISDATTLINELEIDTSVRRLERAERMLEIVLLERSVYQ